MNLDLKLNIIIIYFFRVSFGIVCDWYTTKLSTSAQQYHPVHPSLGSYKFVSKAYRWIFG